MSIIGALAALAIGIMPAAGTTDSETAGDKYAASEAQKPYISKMPEDGVFNLVVLGDSLASGLYQGLTRLNKDNEAIATTRKSKVNTGIVRVDRYDWNRGAKRIAASGKYEVAVVLLGLNDLQSFREKGKAYHFQTEGWVERYKQRISQMMSDLKSAGMAVYWVSIPASKKYTKEYLYLNGFYREEAKRQGVRFVDTWAPLAGPDGGYTPFWKDADGKSRQIRMNDGIHFTSDGYLIFAGFLNNILAKDMEAAQRLAGKQ